MSDIADFLDWFHERLRVELAKHAVRPATQARTEARPFRLSPEDKQRICDLWRENFTITEIAAKLRREPGTVRYTLRKAKLYE